MRRAWGARAPYHEDLDGLPIVIRLRRATPRNALEIAELHARSWRDTYAGMLPAAFLEHDVSQNRMTLWKARFDAPAASRDYIIVAMARSRVAGFACLMPPPTGAASFGPLLDNLHVRAELKGRRIGSRLLTAVAREALRSADRMHLWVLEANAAARGFYTSHGAAAADVRHEELVPGAFVTEVRYVWEPDALRGLSSKMW